MSFKRLEALEVSRHITSEAAYVNKHGLKTVKIYEFIKGFLLFLCEATAN
jgi:hypothetical protein